MHVSKLLRTLLLTSGLLALGVGASLLLDPIGFESSLGITLDVSPSGLSEVRAPGGALFSAGILMIAGAFVQRLTFTSLIVSTTWYLSYGASRVFGLVVDGTPHDGLVVAGAVELSIGLLSGLAVLNFSSPSGLGGVSTELSLANEKYIALTTFMKDGTPKSTPVWPVDAGNGQVAVITSSHTWKVKRLVNNSHILLQPSDARGRVREGTNPTKATALLADGHVFESMNTKLGAKYGIQLRVINLMHALPRLVGKPGHPNDRAIIITFD